MLSMTCLLKDWRASTPLPHLRFQKPFGLLQILAWPVTSQQSVHTAHTPLARNAHSWISRSAGHLAGEGCCLNVSLAIAHWCDGMGRYVSR